MPRPIGPDDGGTPNVPSGRVRILIASPGFKSWSMIANHDALSGTALATELQVGSTSSSIEVTAQAVQLTGEAPQNQSSRRQNAAAPDLTASANVADLQKRVVGVLPISIDVPKTGNSYKFVRPLVWMGLTRLSFPLPEEVTSRSKSASHRGGV